MDEVRVPLLDLKAQYAQIRGEIGEALERVLATQRFVMGPEVESFERAIAAHCETDHAIGCASGSDAMLLALMAHDIGPGDEVICPTYTFFATASAVVRLGAVPVFADIDPRTFGVNEETISEAASRCGELRAIVPVHLFGQAAPMGELLSLAEELEVPVIEDAAQAMGASDADGRRTGSRASLGCFSFFPSKNLGGYGDGGLITTNDATLAARIRLLANHGESPKHHFRALGINSRLDALQAAVLRVKLAHLDAWIDARRANAARYDELFELAGAGASATTFGNAPLPVLRPIPEPAPSRHTFNQYVIRVPADRRDALREHLRERGIGTDVYYPEPLHLQPCFASLGYAEGDFPVSEEIAGQALALPIYAELSDEQMRIVVEEIAGYFEG